MHKIILKSVSFLLVISFALLDFTVQTASAQILDTQSVIAAQQQTADRERVAAFLGRDDVRQVLMQQGVDAVEAQQRVASLSDAELAKISRSLERLPAGGDAGGSIIGAAVFIFVLLLITDILGFTHIFPFVNARR
jgi:Family of unknown function (DUF6627)